MHEAKSKDERQEIVREPEGNIGVLIRNWWSFSFLFSRKNHVVLWKQKKIYGGIIMDDMTMHAMQIMVMMIATLIGFMFIYNPIATAIIVGVMSIVGAYSYTYDYGSKD